MIPSRAPSQVPAGVDAVSGMVVEMKAGSAIASASLAV